MSKKNTKAKRIFALLMAVLIAVTYMPNPLYAYAEDYLDDDQVTAPSDEYVEETPQDEEAIELDGDAEVQDDSVKKVLTETETESTVEDTDVPVSDDTAVDTETDGTEEPSGETSEGTVEDGREPLDDKVDLTEVTTDTESQVVTKETETEAETISYPSHFFKEEAGGVKVAVSAPEGALPEGTTMEVTPILAEDVEEAVSEAVSDKVKSINAVDITFKNAEGQEIEPLIPVSVTLNVPGMNRKATKEIVHIDDEGTATTVDYLPVANTGASLFESDQFSVYVVVETEVPRLFVKFMNGDTEIATMIIKDADTAAEVDQIIYDPGAGTLASNEVFKGWSTTSTYSAEGLKTIDQVRTDAMALADTITADTSVTYYAAVFKQFTVTYIDVKGVTIGTEVAEIPKYETEASYTVNQGYSTDDTHNFEGWLVADGLSNITDPSNATAETLFPNGTVIKITGNVKFSVSAPEGHWLVFDENGKGATYNAPRFVKSGEVTSDAGLLEMVRNGYTFGGWYKDAACTAGQEFTFGGQISETTTIYAKWIAKPSANYTVIIWRQKVTGDGYDFAEAINLSGSVGSTINTVVQNGSSVNTGTTPAQTRNVRVDGTEKAYTGFHCASFDQNKTIAAEGNTVLNVYYDRNTITITFNASNNSYSYVYNENTSSYTHSVTYTGLFEAPLTFTWPNKRYYSSNGTYPTNSLWTYSGTTLSFIGSFKLPNPSSVTITLTGTDAGSYPRRFIQQNIDGSWPDTAHDTVNMSGGTFTITDKYTGFYAYEYRTNSSTTATTGWSDWTRLGNPDSNGDYARVSNASQLEIRFARIKSKITYMDGAYVDGNNNPTETPTYQQLHQTDEMYYGTDVTSYGKTGTNYYKPTAPQGYVFEGWYADKNCTQEYTFTTMPAEGITVYAKWRQIQIRVFLHPQAGTDSTLDWGSDNQQMTFRVAYGGKISVPTGKRTGYEFYGWYTDAACTQVFTANAQIRSGSPYNKNTDFTDKMDKWGNVSGDATHSGPWNSDLTGNNGGDRFWITQKLDLYAKWSAVTVGADGIGVVYDANGGSNAPTDTALYKDNTIVTAGSAPTAPTGQYFDHWVLQTWNGTAYEDTTITVPAGGSFTILQTDARIVKAGTDEVVTIAYVEAHGTDHFDYTVKLKAVYKDKEEKTPTHIAWYSNYGSENGGKGTLYRYDTKDDQGNDILKINEAVDILGPQTRTGYVFKGWTKTQGGTTADFLVWDGSKYTTVDGTTATKVAADEKNPIEDLFAVWEPIHYTVHFEKNSDEATGTMEDQSFAYDEEKALTANAFTRAHYTFTGWNTAADGSGTGYTDTQSVVNLTATDGDVITLYAQWTLNQYPYTIHHYLKGTTTQVKADDTGNADFGSTVTATPATEYQGVALTVDSYVQSQTITIAEEGNVITVYYTITLTVRAKTDSKVYDGQPLYGGYTAEGALPNDVTAINAKLAVAAVNTHITNVAESVLIYALLPSVITNDYPYYTIYNYEGTLTINPRPVTVTAKSENFTYDGNAHSNPGYDVEGLVGNDAISAVVTGSITFPSESPVTNEVTSYEFTSGTAGNYDVTTVNGQLTMTSASVAITITAASDEWTYDGNAHSNNEVTVTSGQLLNGDTLVATATGSVTNVADTATGNNPIAEGYKIMHGTEDVTANYVITTQEGTLTINPKAVTITAQDKAFTYTGEAQSWPEYDVDGLVGDDAISAVVTGSITFPSQSPVTNTVSSYTFTTGTPGNYTVTTANGQLTMTAASVAITITAASDEWTYDGAAHQNTTVTVTSGELLPGDELVATATGSVTNVADTTTGNNPIAAGYKIMHGTEDVTANYVITTEAGTLTINPKAVTITAQSKAFVYTGAAQSWPQYDVVGLVGDDAISAVVTGSITFPSESPVTNELTSYEFTVGTPGNYTVTTANGQLTMTNAEAAITITAASDEWTYDGNAHQNTEVTVTSGELLPGDELVATTTGSVTNVADTATGNNPIAEGYKIMHGDQDVTANYAITTQAGTLTIKPKAVTITAQDKAFTYTGEAQSWPQYDVDGLVGDDAISAVVTGSITFPSQSPVTNTVASYEFTTGTPDNYTVTTANGQLTMTTASVAITIKAADDSKTYDGTPLTNATVTVTEGTLLTGDELVATATGSATNVADTATGNNPIADGYKIMHGTEDVTENYVITTEDGTLTILPKAVTVTAQDKAFAYTGEAQSWPQYDVDGLVGDDAISAVVTGSITFPSESPVTNELTSYEFTSGTPGNYTVSTVNGQLTMTAASVAITITAASDEWTYDGSAHQNTEVTVTSGELLPGDELVATATGSVTNVSDTETGNNPIAAGYKIMHGTEDVTANYVITPVAGTLTINPKEVTITARDASKPYDGTPLTQPLFTASALEAGDEHVFTVVMTDDSTITDFGTQPNVIATVDGVAVTTGEQKAIGNYLVTTANGTLEITKDTAALVITSATNQWTYDSKLHKDETYTVTYGGETVTADESGKVFTLPNGDVLTITATAAGVTNVADNAANNNTFTYTVMRGDVDTSGNYENLTADPGTLTIDPRPVTVIADDKTKVYGTADPELTATEDGVVEGDTLEYELYRDRGENVGSYNISFTYPTDNEPQPAGWFQKLFRAFEPHTQTVVQGNYEIKFIDGEFDITPMPLTITAASDEKVYDGTPLTNSNYTATALAEGDTLVSVTVTGSQTEVGSSPNTPSDAKITNAAGEDMTGNYDITYVKGALVVTPAPVNPPKPPKTGDDNHPWGWAGLAGLAMAGLAVLFATRKREEESR